MSPRSGLSPRVRGNQRVRNRGRHSRGSIPARAGEPFPAPRRTMPSPVYPRACGGTVPGSTPDDAFAGLSPRVRGNPSVRLRVSLTEGSIPARAGEPTQRRKPPAWYGVYPRACGGTTPTIPLGRIPAGLSPRVRGNPASIQREDQLLGSIPARAGEPCWTDGATMWLSVYPRACGGTVNATTRSSAFEGLSPRVRGNLERSVRIPLRAGSIPARAGEPATRPHSQETSRVYPRACGGTVVCGSVPHPTGGLSPRVRGNPRH